MNAMAGIDVRMCRIARGAAVTDVATGAVTMSFSSSRALALIQDGKLRAVAVTSRERMLQLPDVAPFRRRAGAERHELLNWFAMFGHRRDAGADRDAD